MAATDDMTHVQIIEWVVGTMILIGGTILEVVRRMIKGKKNRVECDLIHKSVTDRLDDIKEDLKDSKLRMEGMNGTLIEIATTLKIKSQDETDRYMKHSDAWKKE